MNPVHKSMTSYIKHPGLKTKRIKKIIKESIGGAHGGGEFLRKSGFHNGALAADEKKSWI